MDDWAWRKGQNCGTILVDLDQHRVVDLLPGRSSDELRDWLRQHSNIEVITRDRCGVYADGDTADREIIAAADHLAATRGTFAPRVLEQYRVEYTKTAAAFAIVVLNGLGLADGLGTDLSGLRMLQSLPGL